MSKSSQYGKQQMTLDVVVLHKLKELFGKQYLVAIEQRLNAFIMEKVGLDVSLFDIPQLLAVLNNLAVELDEN
jgi:hypothetical protein